MAKATHKEVFDLLVQQVVEAYPQVKDKLDFISKDILTHLPGNSAAVKERLSKGSFIKDDGQIDPIETFLLGWVEEVWETENGNQELYDKLLKELEGTPQEFEVYDKELPKEANLNS
ncbi:MAG: hypothetical protein F6K47_33535 [Symploca sp. SIO2E6]|nr:hypothetical protein [Symploca sp. SIO2E6]